MVPVKKVEELILRHKNLEAELSSGASLGTLIVELSCCPA